MHDESMAALERDGLEAARAIHEDAVRKADEVVGEAPRLLREALHCYGSLLDSQYHEAEAVPLLERALALDVRPVSLDNGLVRSDEVAAGVVVAFPSSSRSSGRGPRTRSRGSSWRGRGARSGTSTARGASC